VPRAGRPCYAAADHVTAREAEKMTDPRPAGAEPEPEGLLVRPAGSADLATIVDLLADDPLGATRERTGEPVAACYEEALAAIRRQGSMVLVAELAGRVVGCLQLTLIPGLSHQGALRAQIEAVRVARDLRRRRIGEHLIRDAIERARQAGCRLVQLTSHASRTDARRFYARLGFTASHVGMKLPLE
jgi:ribosomal protein S18 acetylase RimI-like enzyme